MTKSPPLKAQSPPSGGDAMTETAKVRNAKITKPKSRKQKAQDEPGVEGQEDDTPSANKERAYIAASRRKDRSLEARMQSAMMAADIHYKRTGKKLKVSMDLVEQLGMYEEVDDRSRRRSLITSLALGTNPPPDSDEFRAQIDNYLASQSGVSEAVTNLQNTIYATRRYQAVNEEFAKVFGNNHRLLNMSPGGQQPPYYPPQQQQAQQPQPGAQEQNQMAQMLLQAQPSALLHRRLASQANGQTLQNMNAALEELRQQQGPFDPEQAHRMMELRPQIQHQPQYSASGAPNPHPGNPVDRLQQQDSRSATMPPPSPTLQVPVQAEPRRHSFPASAHPDEVYDSASPSLTSGSSADSETVTAATGQPYFHTPDLATASPLQINTTLPPETVGSPLRIHTTLPPVSATSPLQVQTTLAPSTSDLGAIGVPLHESPVQEFATSSFASAFTADMPNNARQMLEWNPTLGSAPPMTDSMDAYLANQSIFQSFIDPEELRPFRSPNDEGGRDGGGGGDYSIRSASEDPNSLASFEPNFTLTQAAADSPAPEFDYEQAIQNDDDVYNTFSAAHEISERAYE